MRRTENNQTPSLFDDDPRSGPSTARRARKQSPSRRQINRYGMAVKMIDLSKLTNVVQKNGESDAQCPARVASLDYHIGNGEVAELGISGKLGLTEGNKLRQF